MNNIESIGSIIRFHRKKAGLPQKQLATLAGVGKSAVFDTEKGKKKVRLNTLTQFMSVLNIRFVLESPLMDRYNREVGHR